MKKTTSPKTSKVAPRGLSNPLGHRSPQPGSGDPARANSGLQSLILGALLVAGLSLALACCGTLNPQIEAKPAVTATLTARPTERPTPTSRSTAISTATPTPEARPGYGAPAVTSTTRAVIAAALLTVSLGCQTPAPTSPSLAPQASHVFHARRGFTNPRPNHRPESHPRR